MVPFGIVQCSRHISKDDKQGTEWSLMEGVCLAYLDDIAIFSKMVKSYLEDLEDVFLAPEKANLRLKPEKCKCAQQEIKHLGHVLTGTDNRPDTGKVAAVSHLSAPKDRKRVPSFLGICNYYRSFIKDFAKIPWPPTNLTRKDANFEWTEECQQAMETLKERLSNAPILR